VVTSDYYRKFPRPGFNYAGKAFCREGEQLFTSAALIELWLDFLQATGANTVDPVLKVRRILYIYGRHASLLLQM
jgi:hypothetical protein